MLLHKIKGKKVKTQVKVESTDALFELKELEPGSWFTHAGTIYMRTEQTSPEDSKNHGMITCVDINGVIIEFKEKAPVKPYKKASFYFN